MRNEVSDWAVSELARRYSQIDFPEYQREATVWSRSAKQRLIDSMVRQFNISAIYLYVHSDGSVDCVDGRQRLGAIMSFLGANPKDADNEFAFEMTNEIFEDEDPKYAPLGGRTWQEINEQASSGTLSADFVREFREYRIAIVKLTDSVDEREFHLQFARLNLGTIINSGEKLNAMVGEMRDTCFDQLGKHPFLTESRIPTRRFSREQLAGQILLQMFEVESSGRYARTRHLDIQQVFKGNSRLSDQHKGVVAKTARIFDSLQEALGDGGALRNRAMIVSTVLLANRHGADEKAQAAREVIEFVTEFNAQLKQQVARGLEYDPQFRYLIEFQRHVTQASVEKPAVSERARVLEEGLEHWVRFGALRRAGA